MFRVSRSLPISHILNRHYSSTTAAAPRNMRILISGAGIAGPTLAWWLARLGHTITILDKASSMRATGQNIDITGSAITVVKRMNLLHEVRKWNTTEKGTQIVNGEGEGVAKFPLREGGLSGTNEFEILRGDLADIFYRKAKECQAIEWKFGTTVKKVVENGEKSVKVVYSDGQEHTFDLLVAADGQWSSIRKQVFDPSSITVKDLGMFVVHWTVPREEGDNDYWNIYSGQGRRIVTTRPDPHGTIRVMLTHIPPTKAKFDDWAAATKSDRKTQEDLIRRDFGDVGWEMERFMHAMEKADDFYYWPMQQIKMDQWSKGRVICLGDAAYAPTPLTGSGTPLAIIGAYCLAGEISKIAPADRIESSTISSPSYTDIRTALESYEALYHPWVNKIQNVIPPLFPGIMHPRTKFQRWMLMLFFRMLATVFNWEWVQRRIGIPDMEENHDGFLLPDYPEMVRVQDKIG